MAQRDFADASEGMVEVTARELEPPALRHDELRHNFDWCDKMGQKAALGSPNRLKTG
jgi:hypothetical protein